MVRRPAVAFTVFHLPVVPQHVSHQAHVKGFRRHDEYGMGLSLVYTPLDR
jgi:hypothetical protein